MSDLVVRRLGRQDYLPVWQAMQRHTGARAPQDPDEIWFVEHPPVYTLGLNGRDENILDLGAIPLVRTDRGGQVTYHGPGQLVAYVLADLRRLGWGVRGLVSALERAVIALLAEYGIEAAARRDAPGVYVHGAKIASLGLRMRRGCSYHGLSLNVDMDLEPFARIHPCGQRGLPVTSLRALGVADGLDTVAARLLARLRDELGHDGPLRLESGLPLG